MRCCFPEEDEAPELIKEPVFGQLHVIYDSYQKRLGEVWDGFFWEEPSGRVTQPVGDSGMIEIMSAYQLRVIEHASEHRRVLNEAGRSVQPASVA